MRRKEANKIDGIELVLSVSRCKTYKDCPRKYYYTYIKRMPKKEHDYFDLGELVHSSLELFHSEYKNKNALPKNLAALMKDAFKSSQELLEKENKQLTNEVILEARDILRNYMISIKNGFDSEIIAIEDSFNIKLNNKFSIQGYIDRLDIDNNRMYHIKDYKTNKQDKYMEPFQLQTYGIYLLDKYPDIDKFKGSYIMLKLGSQYISYNFNAEDVEKVKNDLIELGDKILSEERWIPKYTKLCDWCDFKDTCNYDNF